MSIQSRRDNTSKLSIWIVWSIVQFSHNDNVVKVDLTKEKEKYISNLLLHVSILTSDFLFEDKQISRSIINVSHYQAKGIH